MKSPIGACNKHPKFSMVNCPSCESIEAKELREATPIEKAIDLINANKNQAEHLTSFEVHNAFYNMLQSLLPYEKNRDRKIAENAWDACEKFIYAEQQNDNYEAIGRDERVEVINKQSYLNKKHPKH